MRTGYYGSLAAVFVLAACSGGALPPTPVPTPTPTGTAVSLQVLSTAETPLSASEGILGTPARFVCETLTDDNREALAADVIALTNAERAKVGAAPLTEQPQLTEAAHVHAIDMGCNLFVSHTGSDGSSPFDRMSRFGYLYSAAAENVAAGYATPQDVVQGWMDSPGHRENMLNPDYTEIGIGYVYNSGVTADENYLHYWAMTLGRPQ